jgi:hypothetical protein
MTTDGDSKRPIKLRNYGQKRIRCEFTDILDAWNDNTESEKTNQTIKLEAKLIYDCQLRSCKTSTRS